MRTSFAAQLRRSARAIVWWWGGCLASAAEPSRPPADVPATFQFGLIGDMPYTAAHATNDFPRLIRELNARPLAFVVHDGDIKSSTTACTDEAFLECRRQFNTFAMPLIYIFGDNEWTDCRSCKEDPRDPVERLAKLREFFCAGDESLGRHPLPLERQSRDPKYAAFRENVRWVLGDVLFCGLNLPGSNNNFGQPEYAARNAANLAWLRESFTQARRDGRRGVMVIIQANPGFELPPTAPARRGFNDFLAALEEETVACGRPVVLVHGDSHHFQINQPFKDSRGSGVIENFTRVETFGYPDVHWVLGTVEATDPKVFRFQAVRVPGNK